MPRRSSAVPARIKSWQRATRTACRRAFTARRPVPVPIERRRGSSAPSPEGRRFSSRRPRGRARRFQGDSAEGANPEYPHDHPRRPNPPRGDVPASCARQPTRLPRRHPSLARFPRSCLSASPAPAVAMPGLPVALIIAGPVGYCHHGNALQADDRARLRVRPAQLIGRGRSRRSTPSGAVAVVRRDDEGTVFRRRDASRRRSGRRRRGRSAFDRSTRSRPGLALRSPTVRPDRDRVGPHRLGQNRPDRGLGERPPSVSATPCSRLQGRAIPGYPRSSEAMPRPNSWSRLEAPKPTGAHGAHHPHAPPTRSTCLTEPFSASTGHTRSERAHAASATSVRAGPADDVGRNTDIHGFDPARVLPSWLEKEADRQRQRHGGNPRGSPGPRRGRWKRRRPRECRSRRSASGFGQLDGRGDGPWAPLLPVPRSASIRSDASAIAPATRSPSPPAGSGRNVTGTRLGAGRSWRGRRR
jgi:hypothetical protein